MANNQQSLNTQLLRQILSKVENLESRVDTLSNDFTKFRGAVTSYLLIESQVQEVRDTQSLLNILQHKLRFQFIHTVPLKHVYNPSLREILEIDGCIVIENYPTKRMNSLANNRLGEYSNILEASQRQTIQAHIDPEALILESKHSLNLQKIHSKLHQVYEFYELLQTLNTLTLQPTPDKFRNMVQEFSLQTFPKKLSLVFSSDDLDDVQRTYIQAIYTGITEQQYTTFVVHFFLNDTYLFTTLKEDIQKKRFSSTHYQQLKNIKSHQQLLKRLSQDFMKPYTHFVSQYLVPYQTLEPLFTHFRGNLGYHQFYQLWFPRFFA